MNNTFIRDDRTKIIKNRAAGYSNYDYVHFNDSYERYCSMHDTISINEENVEVAGAGQLWTTVRDFYLWDKNFHNNILGKSSKEFIEVLITSGLLNDGEECGYGCGLFLGKFYGNKLIQHGGCAGGYSAYYALLPEKKLSVIVFGNHTGFFHDIDVCNEDGGLTHGILKLLIGYEDEKASEDENESAETNINQAEFDLDLSGKYMDPISSCIWNIRKKKDTYYVDDYLGNSTKIFYYGDGVFKSVDKSKTYTVVENNKHISEGIQLHSGKIDRTFYPFCGEKIDNSELKVYEGSYYCENLGVSYNVMVDNHKLFISNENRHNNALDLYYTPAIRDTFISAPNNYIPYYCTTFSRDANNEIISFSYRDDEETLRENFVFVKMAQYRILSK
ncbi:serine hydrolase [Clostridium sp. FP1]|uniref:serine hydrolase n=1 Tax=Clostridium sp. FP1 TaxID=2724076 RepID=UPI0021E1E44D|nr:serine hydrolase [Clostridium sp. FP1]